MNLSSIQMEEDSICSDLLAIGVWLFKLGLLWNAVMSITEMIASMKLKLFLLLLACSIQIDFTLPNLRQVLSIIPNLAELCRTLVVVLSRVSFSLL
jgi:hypothetical protein